MKVPLFDLEAQYAVAQDAVERAIAAVISSQRFILGPVVEQCEKAVAAYCSCRFGIGVSSGSDALLVCLMAEGIGPGDEVITSAYSFFATAGCIARVGAKPVFVDIDPETCNIDVSQVEQALTPKTRAVIPVHLYGRMADMDPVMEIAEKHGLTVIEDAAQSIGASYRGRPACSIGHYGCLSFFPAKNLGCFGDGGMVLTQDEERAERIRVLRVHGAKPKYYHKVVGGNFRLDAIQAAVVKAKLPFLDAWNAQRKENAARYDRLFAEAGLIDQGPIQCPAPTSDKHVYNQYVIRAVNREDLMRQLAEDGVGCAVYYPKPLHLQECFSELGYRPGDLPESELAAEETLAIPIAPRTTPVQAEYVVQRIARFYTSGPRT